MWHPKSSLPKFFMGTQLRREQELQSLRLLSQVMTSTLNPTSLAEKSIQVITQSLEAQEAFLFVVSYEVDPFEDFCQLNLQSAVSDRKIANLAIKNKSPLLPIFKDQHRTLSRNDYLEQSELNTLSKEEQEWFKTLHTEYYIPIHAKGEWAGLLALGPKVRGRKYNKNELKLIDTIADMLSLALQNIRLSESLLRVNNEFRRAYQALEQSNRQLKQLLSKLEKIDRTKSDFIHIASHELRTPLTVMMGYNELLREAPELKSNEYQAQLLDGIHKGILRMQEIVEIMLVMASIDARSLALNKKQVSISALIHAVLGGLVTALTERKLNLTTEKLSDLPLIEADEEALKKVFYQVITNAIKYTPDGGSITITGSPATIGPDNMKEPGVEIIISDTGIGIDPKHLELIFTKFYITGDLTHYSSGKIKYKGGGPGLGLAIAKGIVEAHGGKIWATSPGYDEEKCPGSQFHILLPLKNVLE